MAEATNGKKVVVVMPALNAAATLEATVERIPSQWVDEIILVDDKSSDQTIDRAREKGVHVIWHPHNVGYGGNQKTCYLEALQRDADVVVMLHPDGQYEPELIPDLIAPILSGEAHLVLGSRLRTISEGRATGMPMYKIIANRFLTTTENLVMRTKLTDLHTGYRAYSRELLLTIPFLRNSLDFSFDSEVLFQTTQFGFAIAEVPAKTRYGQDVSSIGFKASTIYGLKTLWMATRLQMHRLRLVRSRKFRA